jgi:NAD-dependent deacetylase
MLRPAVVWFGEQLPGTAISRAAQIAGDCDVFLVVGTSAVVQPAASYARLAAMGNALVAEVNLEPTPLSASLPVALHGPAEEILPAIVETVRKLRDQK